MSDNPDRRTAPSDNQSPLKFRPGMIRDNKNGTTTSHQIFELPDGREAMVAIHTGEQQPEEQRLKEREAFLLTTDPRTFTEGLEREIATLTEQLEAFTGYDRDGEPLMRLTGRAREVAEMRLASRRNAWGPALKTRKLAEQMQAKAKAAKAAEAKRVEAAAAERAQEMIEEAEIERRAKQIAARVIGPQ